MGFNVELGFQAVVVQIFSLGVWGNGSQNPEDQPDSLNPWAQVDFGNAPSCVSLVKSAPYSEAFDRPAAGGFGSEGLGFTYHSVCTKEY